MAKLYNLARVSTATVGTGTLTLGAAVSGYLTFALAGVVNADVVDYAIKDGANSEHGTGTYTSGTLQLTRTVTKSTNANALISLSGSAEVFISPRAETLNDATLFTTGTLADARLSSNVPLKNAANSYAALNTYTLGLTVSGGTLTAGVTSISGALTAFGGSSIIQNYGAAADPGTAAVSSINYFLSSDTGPSGFALHRSSIYAVNIFLDTNNAFGIGGWSDGNSRRFAVTPAGDGFFARSLGVNVAASGIAGDVKAKNTAKAWVNFVGGTGAANASFGVSSVTKNGTGDYTANFSPALPSAIYTLAGAACSNNATNNQATVNLYSTSAAGAGIVKTTTTCRFTVANASTGGPTDFGDVSAHFFGA